MFISFFFSTLIIFMLLAIILGAPLVPSKPAVTKRMVELLKPKAGEIIYDLGSGDGRVLIEIAKRQAQAYGIELNPYAVIYSWIRAHFAGVGNRFHVRWSNYWWNNLSDADSVIVYGLPHMMPRLTKKFQQELKPGTKIVSNSFQIPGLKLLKTEIVGKDRIYLYQV